MLPQPGGARLASPVFIIIILATFAYFVSVGTLLPTLPLFIKGPLHGGSVAVGLAAGALNLAALVLNLWAGRLGDRRGRRVLMTSGAVIAGASVAGLLAIKSLPALVMLRLIGGAGEALFFVGAASAVNDIAPDERRGEAVSFFSLALHSGLAVGPLLGESVLAGGRFSAVWILSASSALAAAALGSRLPDTRPAPTSETAAASTRLVHPAAVMPGLVLVAGGVGVAGFNAFIPLYAMQIGLGGSRYVFAMFSAILIGMRTLGARIPDRLGPIRSALAALLGTAAGLAIVSGWRTPAGLFAGTVIFALGHALLFPGLLMLAVRRAPAHQRGGVIGTLISFLDLGFVLGPLGLGVVANGLGYPSTFLTSAGVAAGGLILLWRFGKSVSAAASP